MLSRRFTDCQKLCQQESAQRHAHTKWSGSLCSVDVAEQKTVEMMVCLVCLGSGKSEIYEIYITTLND